MVFLSVIIPVYNVEKYLRQCVDSVLYQKLDNIEIILVDDGSPDCCPQICDEYAKAYSMVQVIHKENGGLSSARNTGINQAKGEYIVFLDSDDWWNPEVNVQSMMECVKNKPEIEMFLFTSLDYTQREGYMRRNDQIHFNKIVTASVSDYYDSLIQNGNFEVHACTKILRRDFLINNKLYFKIGLLSEDNEWIIRVLRSLRSVELISEPLYIYRSDRQTSITHTIKDKNIKDLLYIVDCSIQYCNEFPDNPLTEKELCFASYLWFCALGLSAGLSESERKNVRFLFDKTSCVSRYGKSRKTQLSYFVYRAVGYAMTAQILGYYIQLKNRFNITRKKFKK